MPGRFNLVSFCISLPKFGKQTEKSMDFSTPVGDTE
jgi:hypothetical protein